LAGVWVGGYAFLFLVAAGCIILAGEWVTMCGYSPRELPGSMMPALIVAAAVCAGFGWVPPAVAIILSGTVAVAIGAGWGREPSPVWPIRHSRTLAFGVPYLGLAAIALPWLRADPEVGLANTLFVLSLIWASDIGAYLVGRLAGGPKLWPAISPGKTWSGAAGGLASAALAGLAVAACFSPEFSSSHVIVPAIGLGIVSQAGDLFESALKRHFGVKDSGGIIPGHGGMLDRLDALLAVAPVAAVLAFSVGRGVVLWR
jgi:phosphatidate cytidylyltransferase